jgi:hypothetical protein
MLNSNKVLPRMAGSVWVEAIDCNLANTRFCRGNGTVFASDCLLLATWVDGGLVPYLHRPYTTTIFRALKVEKSQKRILLSSSYKAYLVSKRLNLPYRNPLFFCNKFSFQVEKLHNFPNGYSICCIIPQGRLQHILQQCNFGCISR